MVPVKRVCIDAGHGGKDPGAVGPTGLQEKVVTLAVSLQVAQILKAAGLAVKLTRTDDSYVVLSQRADISNQFGADAFVSVHVNSVDNNKAGGTETYHHTMSAPGKKLAAAIQKRLVSALGLADRGVKKENFAVLRLTEAPAALAELAFISNPTEEALLKKPDFLAKAARAIAEGIADFLGVQLRPAEQAPAPAAPSPANEDAVKIVAGEKTIEGIMLNGVTYAPVRALAEALGKQVKWDPAKREVEIL
jgi:N-acetylmuramoyl-L-alanine amidase